MDKRKGVIPGHVSSVRANTNSKKRIMKRKKRDWTCVQCESKEKNTNSKKRIMKRKKRDSAGWRRNVT